MRYASVPTSLVALSFLLVAVSGCSGDGHEAAGTASGSGPAVAVVNSEPISQELLDAMALNRGIDLSKPQLREKAVKTLVDLVLTQQAAKKAGLDKDREYQAAAELGRLQGSATAATKLLQKANPIDDAAVRAEYDQQAAKGGTPEYEFGQLVFATEDVAKKATADVTAGKPFDQVLEAYRKDARMARNFPKVRGTMLPPPMAAALAELKPGETTKAPVQIPQGWAVIHLTAVTQIPQPPFEQVKEGMRRSMIRRAAEERMNKLREEAKITYADAPAAPASDPAPAKQ